MLLAAALASVLSSAPQPPSSPSPLATESGFSVRTHSLLIADGGKRTEALRDLAHAIGDAAVPAELLPHPLPEHHGHPFAWPLLSRSANQPKIAPRASFTTASSLSLCVCTMAVLLQTIQPSGVMAPWLREALHSWAHMRLQHHVVLTTACAFCMYCASDVLSQVLTQHWSAVEKKSSYRIDTWRLLRSGAISSLLSGFLAVYYFTWLEKTFKSPPAWAGGWAASGSWAGLGRFGWLVPTLLKVAADVGCYEAMYDCLYVSLHTLLRGDLAKADGMQILLEELAKVPRIWRMSPRYWGPIDFVNFAYVDLRLRPLYNACFSIPWAIYLSSMANDDAKETKS